ncbi:MAG: LytTR family DNA-binding domain-containing protein [Saprospiraceae bacterium]|nr:LytTR family DNA-binding domain-containing protein [Saprospiraceae bacterium]
MDQTLIKCLIVDDEKLARTLLETYVKKIPRLQLIAKCKNALEAKEILGREHIDLMFLDIQMPELTGIEFLKDLDQRPTVIFTTAYAEYALEGYQLDVADYMLKPIPFPRFEEGVQRAIDRIELLLKAQQAPRGTVENAQQNQKYITVKADHRIYKIMFADILYIEGMREYVSFQMADKRIIALESLKKLENILPNKQFMRVHKSYIINSDYVESLYGNLIELKGKQIPIGKSYREKVVNNIF